MKEKDINELAQEKMTRAGWQFWFPPHSYGRERDIFGVFDCVAILPTGFLFIQLTSIQHISDREKKIMAWVKAKNVKLPAGGAEVWAWDPKTKKFTIRKC